MRISDIPQVNGFRAKYLAFFAADDWKVNNKLTVNLGLRYDMPIPVTEQANRMSYVDPTLAEPGGGRPSRRLRLRRQRHGTPRRQLPAVDLQKGLRSSRRPRLFG